MNEVKKAYYDIFSFKRFCDNGLSLECFNCKDFIDLVYCYDLNTTQRELLAKYFFNIPLWAVFAQYELGAQ